MKQIFAEFEIVVWTRRNLEIITKTSESIRWFLRVEHGGVTVISAEKIYPVVWDVVMLEDPREAYDVVGRGTSACPIERHLLR